MKYDGHVKLTKKAIEKLKNSCPISTGICNAPMFDNARRVWLGDDDKSNATDNYSAAIFNYISHSITPDIIKQATLPDVVAFVDLKERWTHEHPDGQRYHFMRAPKESNLQAYENGVKFIKAHTEKWVEMSIKAVEHDVKENKPLQNATWKNTRAYIWELALALHALQDSFSPGHVKRIGAIKLTSPHSGITDAVAPISGLYVYTEQDHDKHGEHDYGSGSPDSEWGATAVNASIALMSVGILSIAQKNKNLVGWEQFKFKWLMSSFKIN